MSCQHGGSFENTPWQGLPVVRNSAVALFPFIRPRSFVGDKATSNHTSQVSMHRPHFFPYSCVSRITHILLRQRNWPVVHGVNGRIIRKLQVVLYCTDGVVIAALMHCDLLEIYCAPPNLETTKDVNVPIKFCSETYFSGLSCFNEPEISVSGPPA